MSDQSDARTSASLLGRVCRAPHDAAAWQEFVHQYGPRIIHWCRRWKLQDADAEDVAQNVLLAIARQMRTFTYDPSRSFRGWLRTLTHAAWCDWLEKRRRAAAGSGDSGVLDQLHTIEARADLIAQLEVEYDCELLEEAMARVQLRVERRTWDAFRLLTLEELSGAEVAERLGMRVGTVFTAKSKVQKMLREEVQRLDPEAEAPAE